MDYYGEADIVLSSLTEYADNHSNNHNSHRLLYQYMRKYDCASELYIPVLRVSCFQHSLLDIIYNYDGLYL